MTDLTERFEEALALTTRLHRHQRRKGSGIAYVSHLLAVASIALELGADEDQAIAALLHDAVEDQGGQPTLGEIRTRFGQRVADMVEANTDGEPDPESGEKAPWRERKIAYLEGMAHKSADALLVSLADKIHNAQSINEDLRAVGEAVWARFKGGREGSLWYYRELAKAFEQYYPHDGVQRLSMLVRQMEEAAA